MSGRTSRPRPTAGPAVGRRRGPREPEGRRSTGESSRRLPGRRPRRAGSRPAKTPSDRRRFSRSLPAIAPTTASGAPDADRARAVAPRANPSDSNGAHISVSGAANGSSRRSAIPLASKKSAARWAVARAPVRARLPGRGRRRGAETRRTPASSASPSRSKIRPISKSATSACPRCTLCASASRSPGSRVARRSAARVVQGLESRRRSRSAAVPGAASQTS